MATSGLATPTEERRATPLSRDSRSHSPATNFSSPPDMLRSSAMTIRAHVHGRRGVPFVGSFSRLFGLVSRHWERKRFYQATSVYQTEDGEYGVCLDQRRLRTPLRKLFSVPSKPLAVAVSQEWEAQSGVIQPSLMHLTALCNTVIDNPLNSNKDGVVSQALNYLSSDTICFRSTEETLSEQQCKEWDPVLSWFNERFNGDLKPTTSLTLQPPSSALVENLISYICQLNKWSLVGFSHALESTSSVVLACALMDDQVDPLEASCLAQMEMRHQIERWGSVEWKHEIEAQDLLSRLSASLLVSRLVPD